LGWATLAVRSDEVEAKALGLAQRVVRMRPEPDLLAIKERAINRVWTVHYHVRPSHLGREYDALLTIQKEYAE